MGSERRGAWQARLRESLRTPRGVYRLLKTAAALFVGLVMTAIMVVGLVTGKARAAELFILVFFALGGFAAAAAIWRP